MTMNAGSKKGPGMGDSAHAQLSSPESGEFVHLSKEKKRLDPTSLALAWKLHLVSMVDPSIY